MLLAVLSGCASPPAQGLSRFSYSQIHMGVQTRVVLYAEDEPAARSAAQAAFARIAELDAALSDYRQDSELNRLCAGPAGRWTQVSDDLFRALSKARELAEATEGAFDCTIGPLTRLWREARARGTLPDPGAIAAARARVGWRLVELDGSARSVRLAADGMRLDMGGIGKGLAAQAAVDSLRAHGVERCLVALAGDVAAAAPPPDERGWRVAIEAGPSDTASRTLVLENGAVSTSGDAEQYVEIDGVRFSHILDPRTGLGLTTRTAATVVARDGATADALASAFCVLGPGEAARVAPRFPGVAVRMLVDGREHRFGEPLRLVFPGDDVERSTR